MIIAPLTCFSATFIVRPLVACSLRAVVISARFASGCAGTFEEEIISASARQLRADASVFEDGPLNQNAVLQTKRAMSTRGTPRQEVIEYRCHFSLNGLVALDMWAVPIVIGPRVDGDGQAKLIHDALINGLGIRVAGEFLNDDAEQIRRSI